MVGPKHALTAGHVVYDAAEGGWATSVLVTPAYDNGSSPLGSYYATNLYSLVGYTTYEDQNYDFGMLEFGSAVGDTTGWLGYASFSDQNLLGAAVTTAGFPGDLYNGERMYGASGTCSGVSAHLVTYAGTMDTAGGQSGSGVWTGTGANTQVVAVHTFGSPSYNGGTRITSAIFDYIDAVESGGAPPEPPPPPPPGSVESLDVYLGKSKVTDYDYPGIDRAHLKLFYFFNESSEDTVINPISDGITIGIETDGQEALSLTLDADDPHWRVKGRRKAVWNGYIGNTRVKFTMDVVKQTIVLKLDGFDFDPLVFNPIAVTVLCGNDFGRKETNWFEYLPGYFRY
jgi:V8-like Glu-specific endopeptidase